MFVMFLLASFMMVLVSIPCPAFASLFALPLVLGNVENISPDADVAILDASPQHSLTTASGVPITKPKVGEQIVIGTTVTNSDSVYDWPIVALTEVRDSSGITVYLTWQSGIVKASDSTDIGMSWIPETEGRHEIRTFMISDLTNPRILSIVRNTEVNIDQ